MLEKSESLVNLLPALSRFQDTVTVVRHDATNPFYKSKYATLGATIAETRPALSACGLLLVQQPTSNFGEVGVRSTVFHTESGEYISDFVSVPIPASSSKPGEDAGKIITYLRRYGMQTILGIYSGDDDDLAETEKQKNKATKQPSISLAQRMVNEGISENEFSANAIIAHFKNIFIEDASDDEWVIWCAKKYRAAKGAGNDNATAFELADAAYKDATEGNK